MEMRRTQIVTKADGFEAKWNGGTNWLNFVTQFIWTKVVLERNRRMIIGEALADSVCVLVRAHVGNFLVRNLQAEIL